MLNLEELRQFVAFSEYKTLTKVSEEMNISQPTLTRSMKHIEEGFGVPLFTRERNRLELNETGIRAVDAARQILYCEENAISSVQEFDRKRRSITVLSCAPAPLWSLLPSLSQQYPENEISSKLISNSEEIISEVLHGDADMGILTRKCTDKHIENKKYIDEHLYVCVTPGHALYGKSSLTFSDLNGFNCLLRDRLGFWTELCREKMPSSKFLVQSNEDDFRELVRTSTLLCFTTNLADRSPELLSNRKIIPMTDPEVNISYYIITRK